MTKPGRFSSTFSAPQFPLGRSAILNAGPRASSLKRICTAELGRSLIPPKMAYMGATGQQVHSALIDDLVEGDEVFPVP